jgi:hypothetical protein
MKFWILFQKYECTELPGIPYSQKAAKFLARDRQIRPRPASPAGGQKPNI